MNDPTGTLNLTANAAQTVEVWLRREDGSAEDVSAATAAVLEVRDTTLPGAAVLLSKSTATLLPGGDGFSWALSAGDAAIEPGRYWGFVTVTIGGAPVSLAQPVPVVVVNS